MAYLTLIAVAQATLVAFLLVDRRTERREHAAERQTLLQRIQAPEAAVQQHIIGTEPPPSPIPLGIENDKLWHASREDMAEALARADR